MSWNKNSAKVIGITAAAAMALSLAPATAFTAYAAPRNGSSVSEQAVDPNSAFSNGYVSKAVIDGVSQSVNSKTQKFSSAYNGKSQTLIPTEVTTAAGNIELSAVLNPNGSVNHLIGSDGVNYYLSYNTQEGVTSGHNVILHRNAQNSNVQLTIVWEVTPASLKNATLYNKQSGNVSDTTFTFDGSDQTNNIGVALNGQALPASSYSIKVLPLGAKETDSAVQAIRAGKYAVVVTGNPHTGIQGAKNNSLTLTVNPLDLNSANITLEGVSTGSTPSMGNVRINGKSVSSAVANELSSLNPVFVSGPNGSATFDQNGVYTYSLTAANGSKDVLGSKQFTYTKVGRALNDTDVRYGEDISSNTWPDSVPTNINLDDAKGQRFNKNMIIVHNGGTKLNDNQWHLEVQSTNDNGATWIPANENQLDTPGTYRVRVVVDGSTTNFAFGGETSYVMIYVLHEAAAHVYVTLNGKLVGNNGDHQSIPDMIYNGKVVQLNIKVTDNHGDTLTEGTDYTAVISRNAQTVTDVKDAGRYVITVTAKNGYHFNGTVDSIPDSDYDVDTTTFTIKPMKVWVTAYKPNQYFKNSLPYIAADNTHGTYVAYNAGKAFIPDFAFSNAATNGNTVEVPSSAYTVRFEQLVNGVFQQVDSAIDQGTYQVFWADSDANDNFDVQPQHCRFTITNQRYFEDVPNVSYYTTAVYNLNQKRIMNGYNGSSIFGPMKDLQRYQAAVVIYNLALERADTRTSGNNRPLDETGVLKFSKDKNVKSPFKDVNLTKNDTRAVAWAAATGIVTGYGASYNKNNDFKPYQNVSRQEFATMLNRYASKLVDYKAGSADALSKFPDASAVAGWAKDGVDWAVSNNVLTGNNGNIRPNWSIVRADAAVMIDRSGLVK